MPETGKKHEEKVLEVLEQDKKDALDAVVIDMLADELPQIIQKELPNGGNTIVQAPGDKLTIKTGVVNELPKAGTSVDGTHKPVKSVAGAVGAISIATTILNHVDQNKAGNASDVLKFLGAELVREGKLVQDGKIQVVGADAERLKKGMKIAGKAIMIAGQVCTTASKSLNFFLKFAPKKK